MSQNTSRCRVTRFPGVMPRIITDNGPQFVARDFKGFIRLLGMTRVRTATYYPQSNDKIEACHKTLKITTIRPNEPGTLDEARRLVAAFVKRYNEACLLGYLSPADKLAGEEQETWQQRGRKLEAVREASRRKRAA